MSEVMDRYNASERYKKYLELVENSGLTVIHQEPGEDHCCEDVIEATTRKKVLAVRLAVNCIDEEIDGHTPLWQALHQRKIARLTRERAALLERL